MAIEVLGKVLNLFGDPVVVKGTRKGDQFFAKDRLWLV